MIRKDFITVEGCFRDGPMMTEVPTKAEYDDFRQRVNAVVERLDKEISELEDRIKTLETKGGATKSRFTSKFERGAAPNISFQNDGHKCIIECEEHTYELEFPQPVHHCIVIASDDNN